MKLLRRITRRHNPKGTNGDHTELAAVASGLTGVIVRLSVIPSGVRQRSVRVLRRVQRAISADIHPVGKRGRRVYVFNYTGEARHLRIAAGVNNRGAFAGAVVAGVRLILGTVNVA